LEVDAVGVVVAAFLLVRLMVEAAAAVAVGS